MRNSIILIGVSLLFLTCRSSEKLVMNAYQKNKVATANTCYNLFPSKDSVSYSIEYIKGKTDTFHTPPIVFNCDSLMEANKGTNNPNTFTYQCPPSTHTVDTLREVTISVQQSGTLLVMYADAVATNIRHTATLADQRKTIRRQAVIISSLLVYMVVRFLLRFKFPFIYKFLP